jgi:hypothetical protein
MIDGGEMPLHVGQPTPGMGRMRRLAQLMPSAMGMVESISKRGPAGRVRSMTAAG